MNTAAIIVLSVAAFLIVLIAGITVYLVRFTFVAKKKRPDESAMLELRKKQMPLYVKDFEQGYEWIAAHEKADVEITSRDGLTLRGEYFANPARRGTVLLFHGYRSSPHADMSAVCGFYYSLGFSLLLPSQRSHMASDGKYICFGAKEGGDCADWVNYVNGVSGDDLPIVLDGVSMGATTVMASVRYGLPSNVRCIIADCGFTSPGEIISHVMKAAFRMPKFPFYYTASAMVRLLAGFSLDEFNTVDVLKECRIPILFVHGEADDFVPTEMTKRNYQACAAPKELVLIPGAGHGESYLKEPQKCQRLLADFIDKNLG